MRWQKRIVQSLSVVLAFALALAMSFPMGAWADPAEAGSGTAGSDHASDTSVEQPAERSDAELSEAEATAIEDAKANLAEQSIPDGSAEEGGGAKFGPATTARSGSDGPASSTQALDPTASSVSAWDGSEVSSAFAGGDGTPEAPFELASAADLALLARQVNAGTSYDGVHFKLVSDIDLNSRIWMPIGGSGSPFSGVFDGEGRTVSNLVVDDPDLSYAGLFGLVKTGGTTAVVRNVTVRNASVTAKSMAGALAGSAYTGRVENCTAIGNVQVRGNYKVGGLAGEGYAVFSGCSVEGDDGSHVKGVWSEQDLEGDNVGGLVGFTGEGTPVERIVDCKASGLTVSGTRKVGGLLGYMNYDVRIARSSVERVTVACDLTGNGPYLDGNVSTSGIGGLVGVVHGKSADGATDAGAIIDCSVTAASLVVEGTPSMAGYFYGKLRNASEQPAMSGCYAVDCTGSTVAADATAYKGSDGNRAVASVGDALYETLGDALQNATDGDAVTLLGDVEVDSVAVRHPGTIDLNGFTLTGISDPADKKRVLVQDEAYPGVGATLVVKNGSVSCPSGYAFRFDKGDVVLDDLQVTVGSHDLTVSPEAVRVIEGVHLTVGARCEMSSISSVGAFGIVAYDEGTRVDVHGKVSIDAALGAAIAGNGSGEHDGTTIKVHPGSTLDGCSNGLGIYHPQAGSVVVAGGTVKGGTGIEMRAGSLDVSGDAVVTGMMVPTSVEPNGNGNTTAGSGIAIAQHTTRMPIDVRVSGGTISGFSALYESNPENGSPKDLAMSITGGTFNAVNGGTLAVYSEDVKDFITGGTFNSVLDEAYYDEAVYAQNAQDAPDAPGAVVPRTYSLSYDLAGGLLPDGEGNLASYTYFDEGLTLTNPTRTGYTFAGWTGTDLEEPSQSVTIARGSTGDRSFTATWMANADTAYTVEHRFQDIEGDGYALDEGKTQELYGTTDADTAASALAVPGFSAKPFEQAKIVGDGSTVLEIYYDRNVHTVSYAYEGAIPDGASALPGDRYVRYGAPVVAAPAASAPGYTFSGWGVAEGYVMPDEDVVLTGSFAANGDTAYKVEHYQQELDGSHRLAATDALTGATDSSVTAAPKAFTGFSFNGDVPGTVASGSIEGDGSLVLKLYYDRNSYEVAYAYAGVVPSGAPEVPAKALVKFGERVTPAAAPSLTGYSFSGWSRTEAFDMPAEDVEIVGSWMAKADVGYTVHYYLDGTTRKLADDKLVSGRTFGQSYDEAAPGIEGYTAKNTTLRVMLDAYGKEVAFYYTADEARIVFEENGGSKVDDLVGATGEPVQGSLPAPTREGYAFAGWYADKTLSVPVTQLPAAYEVGTVTYYAKWNAVPLPDADVQIQVELPQPTADGSAHAEVPDAAVKAAAEHAQSALETIKNGKVPVGMSAHDAGKIADALETAGPGDTVSVVVSLKFEEKSEGGVEAAEREAIAGVADDGEGVALYLELGVEMTVKVVGGSVVKDQRTVALGEVNEPLLFEIHVDPALVQGKYVRIAHVHEGDTEVVYPESVDREQGIVRFYASKFSTYALLTSETVTVTFESNGGTAVEAQTLKFGERASKPVDPTREGYTLAGWFSDEALTRAYDFSAPVDRSMTLYAKWAAVSESGGSGDVDDGEGAAPVSKPLPQAPAAKKLVATGDGTGRLAASSFALVVLAAAAIVVAAKRRRARG